MPAKTKHPLELGATASVFVTVFQERTHEMFLQSILHEFLMPAQTKILTD